MSDRSAHPSLRRRVSAVAMAFALGSGVVAAVFAPDVRAQEQQQQTGMPTADELIERGVRLREAGRDEEALAEFRRAWEMWPSPRTEAQLALACQAVGRWVEAAEHLAAALSATQDSWIARTRAPLEQAMSVLLTRVGRLDITGTTPGARVSIGGREVAFREGASVFVEPGSAEIEVHAPGYVPVTLSLDVRAGEIVRARVRMRRDPSAEPDASSTAAPEVLEPSAPTRPPRRPGRPARTGGLVLTWVALGATALFGGAAALTWIEAEGADDDLARGCGATRSCTQAQVDDTGGPTFVTLTNVFVVGAALSAVATAVLLFVEWPRARPTRRISVAPGGFRFEQRF